MTRKNGNTEAAMELSKQETTELAQLNNEASLVTLASTPLLPDSELRSLHVMMRQARALKPNQDIPEDTAVMYALEWAHMVKKYGLTMFRDALLKALRESQFFPDPAAIRGWCESLSDSQVMRERGRQAVREHDERVANWQRERAEANGEANG